MIRLSFALVLALPIFATGCGGSSSDAGTSKGGASSSGGTAGNAGSIASSGGTAGIATTDGATKQVGEPCQTAEECPAGGSGSPECVASWPGGYCAVADCAPHGHDCPNDPGLGGTATTGSKCLIADGANTKCLALCASSTDCRDGYECAPRSDAAGHGSANVCVPSQSNPGTGGMGAGGGGGMGAGGGMMDGGM